ncbi:Rha family transcriptional regulator [Burkholderia glumae]|uniref:Rha family transcriptional regulator n=1 Tax=Burkholderia glumae TaxID=337 RepID=UPI003B99CB52
MRQLLAETGDWGRANFGECFEINELANGKREPWYRISKDGFMLLVMGFTGKKALEMKLKFIKAFNAMAAALQSGLWQRRMDAEAAFLAGKDQASVDGRGLVRWRFDKKRHVDRIADLDRQIQLQLQLN